MVITMPGRRTLEPAGNIDSFTLSPDVPTRCANFEAPQASSTPWVPCCTAGPGLPPVWQAANANTEANSKRLIITPWQFGGKPVSFSRKPCCTPVTHARLEFPYFSGYIATRVLMKTLRHADRTDRDPRSPQPPSAFR